VPRRAALYAFGALAGLSLLALTWYCAFHVGPLERADAHVLRGFTSLAGHPHVSGLARRVASLCDPQPYVFLCALPVAITLVRRRPWTLLVIAVVLLGANISTEFLKPLLAHPRLGQQLLVQPTVAAASWPSGHATAAMALALCCVLAAPPRLRPAAAVGGAAFAIAVSYSFLALGWHYPSDALGGFLVAATWTAAAVAAVLAVQRRREGTPAAAGRRISLATALAPAAATLAGALLLALLVLIARPHEVVTYAREHTAFVAGAASIGTLALSLAMSLMLTLRR